MRPVALRSLSGRMIDEQLRRFSARATESIVRRHGRRLGVWVGCGYPKSGTVWLCQLLSSYLELPYPRRYRSPIAMPSVIHAHWMPDARFPETVYVVRDGRDVMVSLYHYEARLALAANKSAGGAQTAGTFSTAVRRQGGSGRRPEASPEVHRGRAHAALVGVGPLARARDGMDGSGSRPRGRSPLRGASGERRTALGPAIARLTGRTPDASALRMAGERFDFGRQAAIGHGTEGPSPFLRKGVAGDWKTCFSSEATTIFDQVAGDTLTRLGYGRE